MMSDSLFFYLFFFLTSLVHFSDLIVSTSGLDSGPRLFSSHWTVFIFFGVLNLYMPLFALSKFSRLLNVQSSWQLKQLLIKSDELLLIKADAGYLCLCVARGGQDTAVSNSAVTYQYNRLLLSSLIQHFSNQCNPSWVIHESFVVFIAFP